MSHSWLPFVSGVNEVSHSPPKIDAPQPESDGVAGRDLKWKLSPYSEWELRQLQETRAPEVVLEDESGE